MPELNEGEGGNSDDGWPKYPLMVVSKPPLAGPGGPAPVLSKG